MKLFKRKSNDEKFAELGYIKTEEDEHGVYYEKQEIIRDKIGYIHVISILHKESGKHLIMSYQKDVNSDGFNNTVGLTFEETKLAVNKMIEMRFKSKIYLK